MELKKKLLVISAILFIAVLGISGCTTVQQVPMPEHTHEELHEHKVTIEQVDLKGFEESDGIPVENFRLKNRVTGAEILISSFGPTIIKLLVPDKNGALRDVILGYDSIAEYKEYGGYHGRVAIGRFCNRIGDAKYINPAGKTIQLLDNNNGNLLHGGPEGWDSKVWNVDSYSVGENEARITFSLHSPDGDQGFEGNVDVKATVILTENNEVIFRYYAVSDKETPIEMAFHGYFNLDGQDARTTVKEHILQINADRYQLVDEELIPNADLKSVDGTKFDFRTPTKIGNPKFGDIGYDDRIVFKEGEEGWLELYSPNSGIKVRQETDQRAVQFYSGYFLESDPVFIQYQGLCIESGNLIDAPNIYHNKDWVISNRVMKYPFTGPGKPYTHYTKYTFSVE